MDNQALAQAVEANLTAFHQYLCAWPEISLHHAEDRIWTLSQRRFSLCNVVLEANLASADLDHRIKQTIAPYLAHNVNVMWKLGPSSKPAELADRLVDQGFLALPTLRGMALDLATFPAAASNVSSLEVQQVRDEQTLTSRRHAVGRGFGWPSYGAEDLSDNLAWLLQTDPAEADLAPAFAAFVGVTDGEPAASSLVFFGAGVAGLYHVSTAPDRRRKGFGSAITATALMEAKRRGYQTAILHATEMGYPVYLRLGFKPICTIAMRLRLGAT
jgi:GNAT superfamily N-acetyltransferase